MLLRLIGIVVDDSALQRTEELRSRDSFIESWHLQLNAGQSLVRLLGKPMHVEAMFDDLQKRSSSVRW